jgi:NIPSNAP protein
MADGSRVNAFDRKEENAMLLSKTSMALVVCGAFAAGVAMHALMTPAAIVHAAGNRVFEIRTYTTPPGKLEALKTRFRDHTIKVFNKYDMKSVGYWVPQDAPLKENTLIYVLSHESREAAAKSWAAFRVDPDWVKAKAESEKDGPITSKVESVFADPTDFSPLK